MEKPEGIQQIGLACGIRPNNKDAILQANIDRRKVSPSAQVESDEGCHGHNFVPTPSSEF
jgi:hypothetical protein